MNTLINKSLMEEISHHNNSNKTPHLSQVNSLTYEFIKCSYPVTRFTQKPNIIMPTHPLPQTQSTQTSNMHTHIITWNTWHINSSLQDIMELIENIQIEPTIILLQETKLLKHKSTTYIDNRFTEYKILYNHTNNKNL